jgi:hypothetical protein
MANIINGDNGVVSGTAGLKSSSDGTGILALQTNGTTAISVDASQVVTLTNALPVASGGTGVTSSTGSGSVVLGTSPSISGAVLSSMASSVITSGTAVASTSGTSINFTSIPSWVKRITVNFNAVSLSGTAYMQVQLGDSGGVSVTGYTGSVTILGQGGTGVSTALSAGFQTENHTYWVAASTRMGIMTITNVSGNIWTANWVLGATGTSPAANAWGGGVKTLTNTLDRLRITTTNGTDTFDAGSINILYE